MRQHRRIEQGLIARIARDGGGEAVRQRETRVSFQMRKEIATRETLMISPGPLSASCRDDECASGINVSREPADRGDVPSC